MDIYEEISIKRAERQERRIKRMEREQRMERIVGWVRYGFEMVGLAILAFVTMFSVAFFDC